MSRTFAAQTLCSHPQPVPVRRRDPELAARDARDRLMLWRCPICRARWYAPAGDR